MQPDFDPHWTNDMKSRPSVFAALTFFIALMAVGLCAPRAQAARPPEVSPEAELWTMKMPGAIVGSPALSFDGFVLYVATANRGLHAVDTETGNILWSVVLPAAPTSAPV